MRGGFVFRIIFFIKKLQKAACWVKKYATQQNHRKFNLSRENLHKIAKNS